MIQKNFAELFRKAVEEKEKVDNVEDLVKNILTTMKEKSNSPRKNIAQDGICTDPRCEYQGRPQPLENFSKDKHRSCGYSSKCKACRHRYNIESREIIKKYNLKYREEHIEEMSAYDKMYNSENKDVRKRYRENNKPAKYETYGPQLMKYEEIRHDPENETLLQVRCAFCKEWFNPINISVQNRLAAINKPYKTGDAHLYCSDVCKINCPVYNRGDTPKPDGWVHGKYTNLPNKRREIQGQLRDMVLDRDEHMCVLCESTKDLICHHLTGVEQNPLESADVDNCITVCKKCDKRIHSQPGCKPSDLRCK